eukprot:gene29217-36345_t
MSPSTEESENEVSNANAGSSHKVLEKDVDREEAEKSRGAEDEEEQGADDESVDEPDEKGFDDYTLASSFERFIGAIETTFRGWLDTAPAALLEKSEIPRDAEPGSCVLKATIQHKLTWRSEPYSLCLHLLAGAIAPDDSEASLEASLSKWPEPGSEFMPGRHRLRRWFGLTFELVAHNLPGSLRGGAEGESEEEDEEEDEEKPEALLSGASTLPERSRLQEWDDGSPWSAWGVSLSDPVECLELDAEWGAQPLEDLLGLEALYAHRAEQWTLRVVPRALPPSRTDEMTLSNMLRALWRAGQVAARAESVGQLAAEDFWEATGGFGEVPRVPPANVLRDHLRHLLEDLSHPTHMPAPNRLFSQQLSQ